AAIEKTIPVPLSRGHRGIFSRPGPQGNRDSIVRVLRVCGHSNTGSRWGNALKFHFNAKCIAILAVLALAMRATADATAADFRVDSVEGKQHSGLLISLSDGGLVLRTSEQTVVELPLEAIVRMGAISAQDSAAIPPAPKVLVTLAGGSALAGDAFVTQEQ